MIKVSKDSVSYTQLSTIVDAAEDKKLQNIVVLDVRSVFSLADYFVIASASNERQVQAGSDGIEDSMHEAGFKLLRREGKQAGRWILLDFADVIVHVFHDEERDYYDLERLWRDCPKVDIQSLQK